MLESLPPIPAAGIIMRLVIPELRKVQLVLDKHFMARNLNVYSIIIQFLDEANMILTSPGKLDEMPPYIDGLPISARAEVWLPGASHLQILRKL